MVMIAAFVMATTFSSYSYAMPSETSSKAEASEHADCHGHGKAAAQKNEAKHEKDDSGNTCCKKGMCKCANGSCHAGVKVFGNGTTALSAPLSHEAIFGFAEQHLTSAFLEGIQKPPRA